MSKYIKKYIKRKGRKHLIKIDAADYREIKYAINITANGYCVTRDRAGRLVTLHRLIMGISGGDPKILVDHKNGNKLDNRKSNLRVCSKSQNERNAEKYKNNTTGYKGVYRSKIAVKNPFHAYARNQKGGKVHIGCYPTPQKAALAHNKYIKKHYGEFAKPNRVKDE